MSVPPFLPHRYTTELPAGPPGLNTRLWVLRAISRHRSVVLNPHVPHRFQGIKYLAGNTLRHLPGDLRGLPGAVRPLLSPSGHPRVSHSA
ncbi:Hypp3979 [Branchiostoma lanceolatum]|uniref:Hypp3979 protein n=1 Tax=Branchiostoma lanceolatum TaxID=7740 RepID=A0A8K0EZD0_BRALA|nr:Hypp3979 [Branchiostoma lanceolatum]